MNRKLAYFFVLILLLPIATYVQDALAAQAPAPMPLPGEPHHHLAFQNDYVKLFEVEVPPHESTLLHQHNYDYLFIVVGNADVSSQILGKPETHLKLADGYVGFTRGGFAHVARNNAGTPFRNVTIELLQPQGALRNLCAQVVANKPTDCPGAQPAPDAEHSDWPEFETNATRVVQTRVMPQQFVTLGDPNREELLVALDDGVVAPAAGKGPEKLLHPGDFQWLERGGLARVFKNYGDKEARFILLQMQAAASAVGRHERQLQPGLRGALRRLILWDELSQSTAITNQRSEERWHSKSIARSATSLSLPSHRGKKLLQQNRESRSVT